MTNVETNNFGSFSLALNTTGDVRLFINSHLINRLITDASLTLQGISNLSS